MAEIDYGASCCSNSGRVPWQVRESRCKVRFKGTVYLIFLFLSFGLPWPHFLQWSRRIFAPGWEGNTAARVPVRYARRDQSEPSNFSAESVEGSFHAWHHGHSSRFPEWQSSTGGSSVCVFWWNPQTVINCSPCWVNSLQATGKWSSQQRKRVEMHPISWQTSCTSMDNHCTCRNSI